MFLARISKKQSCRFINDMTAFGIVYKKVGASGIKLAPKWWRLLDSNQ